ncbi:MAG: hypothetical protein K0U41_06545 [Gammaproteobacteria bacterium]|nr:hypothetical protein [Gammaproteobacteria bacterium]
MPFIVANDKTKINNIDINPRGELIINYSGEYPEFVTINEDKWDMVHTPSVKIEDPMSDKFYMKDAQLHFTPKNLEDL